MNPFIRSLALVFLLISLSCTSSAPLCSPQTCSECAETGEAPDRTGRTEEHASVDISPSIQRACEIGGSDAHFDYDPMQLRSRDAHIIARLASCMRDGPLIVHQIKLFGHVDAVGEDASEHVRSPVNTLRRALVERGVALSRISIEGYGGSSEPDYCARNNRVLVTLRE